MNLKQTLFTGTLVIMLLIGYYLISPIFRVIEIDEESPIEQNPISVSDPILVTSADFVARSHDVEGSAVLIEQNTNRILRFEDFETVNGPNLHIYLASDESAENFVDLGPIKATKGNVNYEIPDDVDLEKYNTVLVYCVPFKVVFSFAELSL